MLLKIVSQKLQFVTHRFLTRKPTKINNQIAPRVALVNWPGGRVTVLEVA